MVVTWFILYFIVVMRTKNKKQNEVLYDMSNLILLRFTALAGSYTLTLLCTARATLV